MNLRGIQLDAEGERIARARFRIARDSGHSRDCAFVFARRYLSVTIKCCCAKLARLLAMTEAA